MNMNLIAVGRMVWGRRPQRGGFKAIALAQVIRLRDSSKKKAMGLADWSPRDEVIGWPWHVARK